MSIKTLQAHLRAHEISDDLESFFWIGLYTTLRYIPWTGSTDDVASAIASIFHRRVSKTQHTIDIIVGGEGKILLVSTGLPFSQLKVQGNLALENWLEKRRTDVFELFNSNRLRENEFNEHNAEAILAAVASGEPLDVVEFVSQYDDNPALFFNSHDQLLESLKELLDADGPADWQSGEAKDALVPSYRDLSRFIKPGKHLEPPENHNDAAHSFATPSTRKRKLVESTAEGSRKKTKAAFS